MVLLVVTSFSSCCGPASALRRGRRGGGALGLRTRAAGVRAWGRPRGRCGSSTTARSRHLTLLEREVPLPAGLAGVREPVVLFFGLLRPYKGVETLLEAWRGVSGAELWIVGRPRMPLEPLRARAGDRVRFIPRFVSDAELPAFFRRADIVVLPYERTERLDWSGVLATALAFGKPIVVSDVGGFGGSANLGAARLVAPGDPDALRGALAALLVDSRERECLATGALTAGRGPYSWEAAARETFSLSGPGWIAAL